MPAGHGYAYGGTAQQRPTAQRRRAGQGQVGLGVLLLVIGLVVTLGTGSHIIAYGAIIFGHVNIVSGAAKMG
jgi:hypothetical protein